MGALLIRIFRGLSNPNPRGGLGGFFYIFFWDRVVSELERLTIHVLASVEAWETAKIRFVDAGNIAGYSGNSCIPHFHRHVITHFIIKVIFH
jgi:hypothetical protein